MQKIDVRRSLRRCRLLSAAFVLAAAVGDFGFAASADPADPAGRGAGDEPPRSPGAEADVAAATDAEDAVEAAQAEDTDDEEFIPTEELSRDRAFDFPVDI